MLDTPQVSGLESGMAYSADDRVRALVALRDCGTYSGAERATGISRETIRGWAASGALPRARRKSPVRLAYEEKVAAVRRPCLGERAEELAARNREPELRVAVLEAKLEILKKTQAPTPRP